MFKSASYKSVINFFIAPIVSISILLFFNIDTPNGHETAMLAVAVLMATWWVLDVIPLAATSLLPIALFPVLNIMGAKDVAQTYFNDTIFLFLGGFLVALAMQKCNLHKRIALMVLSKTGPKPFQILLGFMLATGFLSMQVSNTATAMLMIPILLSVISQLEEIYGKKISGFTIALLLGVAYSASIGGVATLVGTPPNLSFARIFEMYFPNLPEISFARWMFFAFPISMLMMAITLIYLYLRFKPKEKLDKAISADLFKNELHRLGKMMRDEKAVLITFIAMTILWVTRSEISIPHFNFHGWAAFFPNPKYISDGTIAIALGIVLFIIPSHRGNGERVMDWAAAKNLPWDIVLLFGGGFALASGFKSSGFALLIGNSLSFFASWNTLLLVLLICLALTFLTELTSNTATAEMILPVLAALSTTIGVNPLLLMVPATMSCSMAFMLPMATPPNAIVFGAGRVTILQMAKTGFWLNIICAIIITAAIHWWGPITLGI